MTEIGFDLARYLSSIRECGYAIVKLPPHFPGLAMGEDLDIVAADKERVVAALLAAARQDVEAGFVARVSYGPERAYVHFDLVKDDELHLRFDVASRLSSFGAYRIRSGYTERIVDGATRKEVAIGGTTVPVWVAGETDELVVRYLEYHELFSSRPDKIKHLDYVMRAVEAEPARRAFLDRLHENIVLASDSSAPTGSLPLVRRVVRRVRRIARRALRGRS